MPKVPFWLFIVLAILHLSAFYIDVMDVDASQYAEMSREMMNSGSYLHLYDRGNEYLDKPPFLFWVSSLSMSLFGVNDFAFKLPSILFAFWAIYATYRLGRLLYGEAAGRMAALVLGCCQGMFLMTNDIRTDTILMSWTITAIWVIKEYDVKQKLSYLLLGCAAIAFGMMTKGPVALMTPVFCFATDWALKREWKKFFRPAYLLGILVMAVLLLPMSIGLYQQFDMHPEKTINGLQNVSGLRFFYWAQSFGRITGESPWNNGAGLDFLLSSMMWAFLPWILLFLTGLVLGIVRLVKQGFRMQPHQEWLTYGGFILTYFALASSKYQLPHYIFVVFPLAALITAKLLKAFYEEGTYARLSKIFRPVQVVVSALLLVAILLVLTLVFPAGITGILLWVLAAVVWLLILLKTPPQHKILYISAAGIILANIFLTHHFYRHLLGYQLGSQIAAHINNQELSINEIKFHKLEDPLVSMHFYADNLVRNTISFSEARYVFASPEGLDDLRQKGYHFDTIRSGTFFKVSELTPAFLNHKTRAEAVKHYYQVRLK